MPSATTPHRDWLFAVQGITGLLIILGATIAVADPSDMHDLARLTPILVVQMLSWRMSYRAVLNKPAF